MTWSILFLSSMIPNSNKLIARLTTHGHHITVNWLAFVWAKKEQCMSDFLNKNIDCHQERILDLLVTDGIIVKVVNPKLISFTKQLSTLALMLGGAGTW